MYVKKDEEKELLIVYLYEDDMIYISTRERLLNEFWTSMKKKFETINFGLFPYFFGLEVEQKHDSFFVSQRKYANDLLNKFDTLS